MVFIKAKSYEDLSKKAATIIAAQVLKNPNSVLGFATGSSPVGTYKQLIELYKAGIVDFSGVTSFNLDEYWGVPITDPNSYYAFMHEQLFNHINISEDKIYIPSGIGDDCCKNCAEYEQKIKEKGGVDLQLLGIGRNGHIAFNEPEEVFSVATHQVKLTEDTIEANARFYNSKDEVPKTAITMGIGTIMRAKSILLVANGAEKKEMLEKAFNEPVTPSNPASVLQYHNDVTVIFAD